MMMILVFADKKKTFKGKTMRLADFLSSEEAPAPRPSKPASSIADEKHACDNEEMCKYNSSFP